MPLQPGDEIEFVKDYEGDNAFNMTIVWIDPPRAMIELYLPGFSIHPRSIVLIEDIQPKKAG